jgi:hypothetical protein
MLTVVCWLWRGWRPVYKAEHVNRLVDKLKEHLKIPHRVVCATDSPNGIRCETTPIPVVHGFEKWPRALPNCFRRLYLFGGAARNTFGDKCLSIDLDCIILGNLDSLITQDHFKIMRGGVNPYNGSLWQVTPGWRPDVWHELDLDLARQAGRNRMPNGHRVYGSDQVVMAHKIKDAPTWGPQDGVYQYSGLGNTVPDNGRLIFFAGNTKPWDKSCRLSHLY